jgi:hypothetical protein
MRLVRGIILPLIYLGELCLLALGHGLLWLAVKRWPSLKKLSVLGSALPQSEHFKKCDSPPFLHSVRLFLESVCFLQLCDRLV